MVAKGAVFGILAAIVWGISPVFTRLGVQQSLDPYDLTALRFAISGVILLPIVLRHGVRGVGWLRAFVLAAGAGIPFMLFQAGGLLYAPAGHAGLIIPAVMLSCSMLGGWLLHGDKPDRLRLLGYAIILGGLGLIGYEGLAGTARAGAWLGDLMFACAGMTWAMYTVCARSAGIAPLHATGLVAVISMVLFLPWYFVFGEPGIFNAPIGEVIFQGVFQGVFTSILALLFYTRAVAMLGAARGAVFAALTPAVAMLVAYPVLGEIPNTVELSGLVVVSAGLVYALGLVSGRRAVKAAP